jgi:ABC-2 type transport system ATP-binding protein
MWTANCCVALLARCDIGHDSGAARPHIISRVTAIFAEALVRRFPPDIHAVDGIDLDIKQGQIFAFLGANGSGKTTTVRMLTTLLPPTSGRASVQGIDVTKEPQKVRQQIGVALQEASLDDLQTGRELLQLQARLYRVPSRDVNSQVNRLLKIVDLEDSADRRVKTYSGGMKRRLDLAAALVHRPQVIFLDEPTTGLDPISRESIWRYVSQLNNEDGVTFFLTTQYLEEADRLAHDIAIMDKGKIVARGAPEELKASVGADIITVRVPDDEKALLQRAVEALWSVSGFEDAHIIEGSVVIYVRDGKSAVAPVVLALDERSIPIEEISLARPSLDDVFLRKTGHHMEADDLLGAPARSEL